MSKREASPTQESVNFKGSQFTVDPAREEKDRIGQTTKNVLIRNNNILASYNLHSVDLKVWPEDVDDEDRYIGFNVHGEDAGMDFSFSLRALELAIERLKAED